MIPSKGSMTLCVVDVEIGEGWSEGQEGWWSG